MQTITINRYRIVPAPSTGIGWVAVQEWNGTAGAYVHLSTHRSQSDAEAYIAGLEIR
jgi:hypothetical protein